MTRKDDDGEILSKNALDWLTRVGAIATALATIIGVFFPGDEAKRVAFAVAILFAMSSAAVFYYKRRRAARFKIPEAPETLAPSAALRGLLPFEEGDLLPGRARDVQELYTLVVSSTFCFGVLWGESGCGKTSLLRAGLVPALRKSGFLPLYISKPTKDPQEAIRAALKKESAESERADRELKELMETAAPKGKRVVVIFDQFEEFFLTNRTARARAGFVKWLGECVADAALPVVFLVGIRADFFGQLQNLHPNVPEPTSPRTTYQLRNFDAEQAKQIFVAAAKADAIPFEAALIDAVVSDLECEGVVRPAELQIVGTRLKRKNIFNVNKYEIAGRARGILSSYIADEIKQSANEQVARLVLRLMTADAVETKSATDLGLNDILRGIGDVGTIPGARPEQIPNILNQFVAARILIHTDDDKYNLVHDYLAPYVRAATEGMETNVERANRLLKRYLAEYKEDSNTWIPIRRLRDIQKYGSADIRNSSSARKLLQKSARIFYAIVCGVLASVIIPVLTLYIFLGNSYYLSVDSSRIVVRSGHPQLKFFPGFDEVAVQTDYREEDLVRDDIMCRQIREQLLREQLTSFKFNLTQSGYQLWGEQLAARLDLIKSARTLSWLGQSESAAKSLTSEVIGNTQCDRGYDSNIEAAKSLGLLTLANQQIVASDRIQFLNEVLAEPHQYSASRGNAAYALAQLALANPKAAPVTSAAVQALLATSASADISYSPFRENSILALGWLAQISPEIVSPDLVQPLLAIINDPNASFELRNNSLRALGQFVQANPRAITVTPQLVQSTISIVIDPQFRYSLNTNPSLHALGQLALANPRVVTSEMIESFVVAITNPSLDVESIDRRIEALSQLAPANSQAITPQMVQTLVATIANRSKDFTLRGRAGETLGKLAQANPDIVTTEVIQKLVITITDPSSNEFSRSAAAYGLGNLTLANPSIVSVPPQVVNILASDIKNQDPIAVFYRDYTLVALYDLGKADPRALTPEAIQTITSIIIRPQDPFSSSTAAKALSNVSQINQGIVTPKLIGSLIDNITNSQHQDVYRFDAALALSHLAEVNPEFVTPEIVGKVITIFADPQTGDIAPQNGANVLEQLVHTNPQSVNTEIIGQALNLLKNGEDSAKRRNGAYAVFSLVTGAPNQEEAVRTELEKLRSSPQPHWRIAASKTLEMIAVGNLVKEVRNDPKQLARVKARLEMLADSSEDHIKFAVRVALEEIASIEEARR